MSDLFDRVAAKTLGLGMALRPRARSRFEPGLEPLGMGLPGLDPGGREPPLATPMAYAAALVAEDPVTQPASAAEVVAPVRRLQERVASGAGDAEESVTPPVLVAPTAGLDASVRRPPERGEVLAPSAGDPAAGIEAATPAAGPQQGPPPAAQLPQPPVLALRTAREMVPGLDPVASRLVDDMPPSGPRHAGSDVPNNAPRIAPAWHAAPAAISPASSPGGATERDAPANQLSATKTPSHPLAPLSASSADTSPQLATLAKRRAPIVAARFEQPGRASLPEQQAPGQAAESRRAPRRQGRQAEARPETAPPPTIEITIGRLEIRAEPVAAPRPAKPFQPHLDLAAYRAKREGGR